MPCTMIHISCRYRVLISCCHMLLLANHGAVTMGSTLDEAWIRMETLEHGARIILAARQVGQPQPLSLEAVRVLVQQREKDA